MPIEVQHAEPRYFGIGTPGFVLAAAAALLVLGIALAVTGFVIVGIVAIAVAVCLVPVFVAGARRWPDTSIAQIGVSTADRVRGEAGVAVESVSAWTRAGRDVARIRKEQFQLRRRRDGIVRELGTSFYSDDGRADELKAGAKALDEQMASNELELQRAVASARRQTRKGRATVVATEVIKPESVPEPTPEPEIAAVESPPEDEPLTREDAQAEAEAEPAPKRKPAPRKRQARSR